MILQNALSKFFKTSAESLSGNGGRNGKRAAPVDPVPFSAAWRF